MATTEAILAQQKAQRFGPLVDALLLMAGSVPALLHFLAKLLDVKIAVQFNFIAQERARDLLQDEFDHIVEKLAAFSERDIDGWLAEFMRIIHGYLVAQAVAAKGRPLLPTELETLRQGVLREQVKFAVDFARELGNMGTNNYEGYVANRSKLYSGAGRALWFQLSEESAATGWVVDYVAVDDKGTCEPCHAAEREGPYLPTYGPMPGAVCKGRGRCRCTRELRYDFQMWQLLVDSPNGNGNVQTT